jgi:hypothetical protein
MRSWIRESRQRPPRSCRRILFEELTARRSVEAAEQDLFQIDDVHIHAQNMSERKALR